MTTLSSQTTFNIQAAAEQFSESVDLYLFPANSGVDSPRELRYPGDKYPPISYETNPDKWTNFDSTPMTDRPQVKAEMTLESVQIAHWKGYMPDKPVIEYWSGSDSRSRVTADFIRRLYEYFIDPPEGDYITWCPHDRTEQAYKIKIEAVTVGGTDVITFMDAAIRHEVMPWEVQLQFRIIEESN
jgi:hypothetical protein